MFKSFWKNKDDSSSKSGPPGHRGSQPGSGDAAGNGAAAPEPVGGGFFNLPPSVARGPSAYGGPSAAPPTGAPQPGAGAPSQYGRPANASSGHHTAPTYGPPQPPQYGQPQPPSYGNHPSPAPAAPGGGMDMFGGMSLKAPAAAPSGYGSAPPPHQPAYGGYGAPHHDAAPNAPPAPATGGSLFSGLDVASSGVSAAPAPAPYGHEDEITRPTVERRKTTGRSFNYLDVAASSSGADTTVGQRQSIGPGVGAITRPGVNKTVKKKKTKSFRPGFGRQLSDESIAALQRGDLQPEDVVQQQHAVEESAPSAPPRMATNSTDLAHLLPPVKGGSVLAGLTVHDGGSTASSSGGGILAGLTVHSSSSPRGSSKSSPSPPDGGLLAGLNVHRKPSVESDASTSVVLPSSSDKPKKKTPPQEPEKPAAPPTPEEKLMITLRDFHASAVSFRNNALKQNEEENKILERKVQLAKQLNQYEIDLRTIEAQQQQAVEVEDFEKADALNSTINSVRHCITLSESDVRKVDSDLVAFVKAKEKAFTNQLRSTRGTLKELEKFRDDQEAERSALREEQKKYEAEQAEHLQFEAERIETELHHVSSNMDHLRSEKEEIETTIEDQCKNEISLREELLVEKAGVQEEILELERQLKIKVEQMRGIQASIDKAEKDIDAVRSKYSRQLKRIDDREEGLLKTKAEVEADAEQLKEERVQFAETVKDYGVRITAFGRRMKAVKKEMRAAMLLATVLEVQETRREQATVRRKQQTAELTALADSAAIAEQSFVMLRKQHEELEKSLTVHHNAIASAQAMIPQLEQEKKAAAAQRNFKEAARISKDIKALEKDQSTAEEMVEVVEMELQDLKERIEKREAEYEAKKEELKTVEKQLELNTLHELWKEAKSLRRSLRKFEKVKSEGVAAADGVDFRSSALLLVQAEYDACITQVEALESKYDVTDPAAEDEDEEDVDGEDDDDESEDEELDEESSVPAVATSHAPAARSSIHDIASSHINDAPVTLQEVVEKMAELEIQIEQATENEEYERAARLDEQLEALRQHEVALKASQGSSTTGTTDRNVGDDEENGQANDEDDDGDNGDEDGHTPEELEDELRLVRARIKMLEADIERDTENEDYEAAAELEEELQQLREEESEIAQLLADSQHQSESDYHPDATSAEGASMFAGLGMSVPVTVAQEATTSGTMFAGLQVTTVGTDNAETSADGSGNADELVSTQSPKGTPVSPRRLSIGSGPNSPRRKSSVGMFSGLQVNPAPVQSPHESVDAVKTTEDERVAMFEGLQLGSSGVPTSESSVFESLQVVSSQIDVPAENVGSLFGGLTMTPTNDDSDDGVIVDADEAADEESVPLEVTTVAETTMLTTSESTVQTTSETVQVTSETTVQVTSVETTSTIGATSSPHDMFGGLSLVSPSVAVDSTADLPEAVALAHDTASSSLDIFGGLSIASTMSDAVATAETPADTDASVPNVESDATAPSIDMFGGLSLAPATSATTNDVDPPSAE